MRYWEIAPGGIGKMRELEHWLNTESGLDHSLLELVRLRASLMNDCQYCAQVHAAELRKAGGSEQQVADVVEWRNSDAYSKRERAALSWTEVVTDVQDGHAPEAVYDEVRAAFSEAETVNLTLAVATINAWNRVATALGAHKSREVSG
jgi:uncharacterized peroxidase-related enzyme